MCLQVRPFSKKTLSHEDFAQDLEIRWATAQRGALCRTDSITGFLAARKLDIGLTRLEVQPQNEQPFDYQVDSLATWLCCPNTLTSIAGIEYKLTLTMEDEGSQPEYSDENYNTLQGGFSPQP